MSNPITQQKGLLTKHMRICAPDFCHLEWRVKTADNSGGSGITTWKTRGKYSPFNFAGRGGTLGVRFGLAHFSYSLWFFDDFSKLT